MRKSTLFLTILLCISCGSRPTVQKPENILAEDLYVDLFFELELLNIYQEEGASGKTIDSLHRVIFDKYNTDTLQFLESHKFYQSQITEQLIRVDSVITRIEKELVPINKLDSLRNHLE